MAGSFAKIYNAIWADPDFRSLTWKQQWLFFTLISQPELNFAGVLTISPKRLANCASDFTMGQLEATLAELQARRYIVFDDEHDEILVRSYVRHDGAWRTPNVLLSIVRDVAVIRSARIQAVLADEFARLDVGSLSGKKADEMRAQLATVIATLRASLPTPPPEPFPKGFAEPMREPFGQPFPEPMAEPMAEPTVVVAVVGEGVKDRTSVSHVEDHDGVVVAEAAASGDGVLIDIQSAKKPRYQPGSDRDPHFVAYWAAYPRKDDKGHARAAWVKATRTTDPAVIVKGAERFRDDPLRERVRKYIPLPATWLNGERWNDEATTDDSDSRAWDNVVEHAPREFNR